MVRRRHAKTKKHRLPDPADILAGRVEAGPEALFDLIHQVNPTGRGLPDPEQTRRYAVKAHLQSLLIRRFGDRLVEVAASEHDGIVSLAHRSGARDACHAVLAELEPEARSWIQRRLDLAASPGDDDGVEDLGAAESSSAARPAIRDELAGTGELLRRGSEALEDYDYEAAEHHLRLALEHSGGGADAALALLDLLVDLLGMDRQALDLEPRLAAEASAHPGVRALLALAAARLGDRVRALELAAGIAGAPAAQIHAALTARAILEQNPDLAGVHLEAVAEHDLTDPRLPGLADEIAALRAESQRPAEEALERRRREEGSPAAEDDARALLARWPESEVARRILREVAARQRAEEIAAHLARGEEALEGERFHDAAAQFLAALDAGSLRSDLPALIERARVAERRQQETALLAAAVDRFSSSDLKPALLGYLALPEALRERLRDQVDRPILSWLDEVAVHDGRQRYSGTKAQATVSAVLALERSLGELRAGRARAALDELSKHSQTLSDVGEARRCLREARSRVAAERRARACKVLEAAREAYREARIEDAKELLESFDTGDLGSRERPAAELLAANIRHSETVQRLECELQRHLESEDLLGALQRARQLIEQAVEPGERQHRRHRVDELQSRIHAAWRREVWRGEAALDELCDFRLEPLHESPRYWLGDGGRELVLAAAWADRLFIRVVDVERRRIVSRVSLKPPDPFGDELDTCLDGDRLWIADSRGNVLELETESWDILGWRSLRELLPRGTIIERATLLPGASFLWLEVETPPLSQQTRVVDLKAWRMSRKLPPSSLVLPIAGGAEPMVAVSGYENDARLYTARGTTAGTEALSDRFAASAAISPDKEGLVIGVRRPDDDPAPDPGQDWMGQDWMACEDDLMLMLATDFPEGAATELAGGFDLDSAFIDGANTIATSLAEGLTYVLVQYPDGERELLTLAIPEQTFDLLHRVEVPFEAALAQDRRSRRVVALMITESCFDVVPLGRGKPRITLGEARAHSYDRLLPFVDQLHCGNPTGTGSEHVSALLKAWYGLPAAKVMLLVGEYENEHHGPDVLVQLCLALKARPDLRAEGQRVARELARRYPRHGGAALLAADFEAKAGNWQEAGRLLGLADPSDLDEDQGRACHFHHLLGLALLRDGRTHQALAAFEKGSSFEQGSCRLRPLIHLTRPMSDPAEPHEHGPDQPVVRQLMGAIRFADLALAAGDPASALAALDRRVVWDEEELQSAARLAVAYLETPASEGGERFRKQLALAFFQHVYQAREGAVTEILLPELNWDASRLAEIEGRARAWLERDSDAQRS